MIKNGLTWYLLLTKRLLKKPSFWAVLLLVPVMVFGLGLAAQEEAHILRIAVYAEPSSDPLGSRITEELEDLDGVVEYTVCGSEGELRREVALSQADAGYILPAELTGMMEAYLAGRKNELPYDGHLISVIANEDTIQLQLAREQFFSVLYPYLSELAAEQFTLEQKEFAGLNEDYVREQIRGLYREERVEDSIFRFAYGTDAPEIDPDQNSYLMTPVRGMLSVFVFFTGLTMGMYLMRDRKAGMFQWVRYGKKPLYYWLSILAGTVHRGNCRLSGALDFRHIHGMAGRAAADGAPCSCFRRFFRHIVPAGEEYGCVRRNTSAAGTFVGGALPGVRRFPRTGDTQGPAPAVFLSEWPAQRQDYRLSGRICSCVKCRGAAPAPSGRGRNLIRKA